MGSLLRSLTIVILWGVFISVVFFIPYPESLIQANGIQLLSFFISLFLALTLTINFFAKNIFLSFSAGLGIVILLILQAVDSLNIVTFVITIIATGLLISYFKKTKKDRLTNPSKIPTLTKFRKGN